MQEIKDIQNLRKEINKEENRRKQFYMVWLCLDFVKRNPEYFMEIGIGWLDNYHFLFNSTIFGLFSDRKLNTINHYFKTKDFGIKKMNSTIKKYACDIYSINTFVDQKCWCIRWCNGFNQSTTLEEAKNWKTIKSMKKDTLNKPKKSSKNRLIDDNLIPFIPFYPSIDQQLNWMNKCASYSEKDNNAPTIGTLSNNNIESSPENLKENEIENDSSNIKNNSNLSDNSINLANANSFDLSNLLDDDCWSMCYPYFFHEYDDPYFFHEYDYDHIDDFFSSNNESIESNDPMIFHFY